MGCNQSQEKSNLAEQINRQCTGDFKCSECQQIIRLKEILNIYIEWSNNISVEQTKPGIYEDLKTKHSYSLEKLLHDYYHLINKHVCNSDKDFEEIYNFFCKPDKKCKMDSCAMMSRNSRDRSHQKVEQRRSKLYYKHNDVKEVICQQILDQMHAYIYHTYDVGFKLTQEEIYDSININDEYKSVSVNHSDSDGYNDNTPFINSDDINDINIRNDTHKQRIGRIIQRKKQQIRGLRSVRNNNNKFMSVVHKDEEQKNENKNKSKQKQNDTKDVVYSFGVRYYYDDEFNNEDLDVNYNIGKVYKDYFVESKYDNLKDELLNNKNVCISDIDYKDLLMKGRYYIRTPHVRKNCGNITPEHLICVQIYTNFDKLQYEYTKTYRKISDDESDEDMKNRHAEFANLGRVLRETVEKHGVTIEDASTKTFYHGINRPLLFTSTLAQFCGPISTSSAYEVSMVFTDDNGVVLELNDGTLLSNELKGMYFDCEWISDYGYEKEKFFVGGGAPLKIVSIVYVKLNENYRTYIYLINILLSIVKGDISINNSNCLSDKNQQAIVRLLKYQLNTNQNKVVNIPKYVIKLLNHIFSNIIFITTRYMSSFATD
eukprot:514300_1